jgi:hypothetical protein
MLVVPAHRTVLYGLPSSGRVRSISRMYSSKPTRSRAAQTNQPGEFLLSRWQAQVTFISLATCTFFRSLLLHIYPMISIIVVVCSIFDLVTCSRLTRAQLISITTSSSLLLPYSFVWSAPAYASCWIWVTAFSSALRCFL